MGNQAKINGLDIYDEFGILIINGLKNMDTPAETKEAQVFDWEDEDGSDYLLSTKLKDTVVSLECSIKGADASDLIYKKGLFQDLMLAATIKKFESLLTGSSFWIKFNKFLSFEWLSTVDNGIAKFSIELTILRGYVPPDTGYGYMVEDYVEDDYVI